MKKILGAVSALALTISATGCCCHHFGGGGGCAPPPCGPCGSNYGGYPAFSQVYSPTYSTAALPTTGFVTASAAPACDCNAGSPTVSSY